MNNLRGSRLPTLRAKTPERTRYPRQGGHRPRITPSSDDTFYTQIVEKNTEVELLLLPKVNASIVNSYEREWQSAILVEESWFGAVESVPRDACLR